MMTCACSARMMRTSRAVGFVEVGVGEVVGVGVVIGVGHAGVAVAEQVELVVSDDPDALGELEHPHRADVGSRLRAVGLAR